MNFTLIRKAIVFLSFVSVLTVYSADLPDGFSETLFVDGISNPTLLAFSPDGRLFVSQQTGTLRVIKNGVLSPTPVLTVEVDSSGEHGLLGVAFDPKFSTNSFLYVYYTAKQPVVHNRLSRFVLTGDKADSEHILMDFDPVGRSIYHCGGTVKFGPDGKLYVGHGDNGGFPFLANAQQLTSSFGKMMRLNSDGTIPTDNPFYSRTTGNSRAIWAYGLRNPFTFDFLPTTQQMFINDVGESSWEEINEGVKGGNFGWPKAEGKGTDPTLINPIYTYSHGSNPDQGCGITGGTFYHPAVNSFPKEYANQYFFTDYCGNWVRRFNPSTHEVKPFAQGIASNPVDLRVGPDGALYYLSKWFEGVYRITYQGSSADER